MKTITFDETRYALVPVEPTPQMLLVRPKHGTAGSRRALWAAMLAASQPSPSEAHVPEADFGNIISLLPGTYYMDPPDGGSVTLREQFERMALDAKRYRWLRDKADGEIFFDHTMRQDDGGHRFVLNVPFDGRPIENDAECAARMDAAIDAAMAEGEKAAIQAQQAKGGQ